MKQTKCSKCGRLLCGRLAGNSCISCCGHNKLTVIEDETLDTKYIESATWIKCVDCNFVHNAANVNQNYDIILKQEQTCKHEYVVVKMYPADKKRVVICEKCKKVLLQPKKVYIMIL